MKTCFADSHLWCNLQTQQGFSVLFREPWLLMDTERNLRPAGSWQSGHSLIIRTLPNIEAEKHSFDSMTSLASDPAAWRGWVIQYHWNVSDGALSICPASQFSSGFSHCSWPCARWLQKYKLKNKVHIGHGLWSKLAMWPATLGVCLVMWALMVI